MRPVLPVLVALLAGCGASFLSPAPAPLDPRPPVYVPGGSFAKGVTNGLSADDRKALYSKDEGIHWLPVDMMLSLKRATDSFGTYDEAFFAHPERLGLYPNVVDPSSDLPLGITKSEDAVPMAGINCATCHTSLISNANGAFFLVDGGSGQFAIDHMIEGMVKSLVATLINPVEFESFYLRFRQRADRRGGLAGALPKTDALDDRGLQDAIKEAVKKGDSSKVKEKLRTVPKGFSSSSFGAAPSPGDLSSRTGVYYYLAKRFVFFFELVKYGGATPGANISASGFGRSNPWAVTKKMFGDHLGYIQAGAKPVTPVIDGGPINTPHVWDFDRQKWIFWTGVTNSMVERNMAQGVALLTDFDWSTFSTTIKIQKLEDVSKIMRKARAPSWPKDILGPIDQALADKGKAIFKDKCLKCHDPKVSSQAPGSAEFNYVDVGTDASYYQGQTEPLAGYDLFADVLAPMMAKVKARAKTNEGIPDLGPYETGRTPVVWRKPKGNAFVAKPLAGIWASAPYLHNGSVPTIADLLKPAKSRTKEFYVGSFVYDSKVLGYVSDPSDPRNFKLDTTQKGNSNQGHEFLVDDPAAVIEFLKSYDSSTTF